MVIAAPANRESTRGKTIVMLYKRYGERLFPHILYHFFISWLLSFRFLWSDMKQCGLCYMPLQCKVLVGK